MSRDLLIAMETKVLTRSASKPNPLPSDGPVKLDQAWPTGLGDILVLKCGQGRTPEPCYTIRSTYCSGELKSLLQNQKSLESESWYVQDTGSLND